MTLSIQLSSSGNNVITMFTGKTPVPSAKSGTPKDCKSAAHPGDNRSGNGKITVFCEENQCCATKLKRHLFSAKNNRAEFFRIFSKLYAGVYEIK